MRPRLLAGTGVVLILPAFGAAADVVCGRDIASFEQTAAELAADKQMVAIPNGGPDFTAYKEERDGLLRQWYVTKPGYPDLKAIICRELEQEGGRFFIKVEARCFGPTSACNPLIEAFRKTN